MHGTAYTRSDALALLRDYAGEFADDFDMGDVFAEAFAYDADLAGFVWAVDVDNLGDCFRRHDISDR